jgi:Tol biopolymer transport system component
MNGRRILTTSFAVVLVVGACSGEVGPRPSENRPSPARSEPATSAPATSEPEPSVRSTEGGAISLKGRIVFDNHDDVWTINADGTDLTQLTDSPGFDFDPSWSPDGTRIAFRSERSGDSEIWVMNADGSDQQQLAAGLSPAWSPDGSKIAYSSPGEILCPPGQGLDCTGLSIMNADGFGQHRVPNTDGGEYPTWSPDGNRIAFNSNLTGEHVMYVVDPDGSNLVDLSAVGEGWQVDWSPDGSSIIFASSRDQTDPGYDDIYVMRPDGSDVRRLTNQKAYTPAWSPDGDHIVFSAPGLFVMNPDGTGVTPLPTNVGETSLPDWTE